MRVWAVLLAGPVLFLLAIFALSAVSGALGTPPERIGAEVAGQAPAILAGVLAVMGLICLRLPLARLWAQPAPGRLAGDLAWGGATGAVLALAYVTLLAPAMTWLQAWGDYVPPGEVLATVSASIPLFFLANVLLAPVVEETIYRGHALAALTPRWGVAGAAVLSCLVFGLLHWTGGVWYMVLTATVAGGAFVALRLWRGSLAAPFAAHLTLNALEFLWSLA